MVSSSSSSTPDADGGGGTPAATTDDSAIVGSPSTGGVAVAGLGSSDAMTDDPFTHQQPQMQQHEQKMQHAQQHQQMQQHPPPASFQWDRSPPAASSQWNQPPQQQQQQIPQQPPPGQLQRPQQQQQQQQQQAPEGRGHPLERQGWGGGGAAPPGWEQQQQQQPQGPSRAAVIDGPHGLVEVKPKKIEFLEGPPRADDARDYRSSLLQKSKSLPSQRSALSAASSSSSVRFATSSNIMNMEVVEAKQKSTGLSTRSTGLSTRSDSSYVSDPDFRDSPAVNLRVFQILPAGHSTRSLASGKFAPYRGDPYQGLADALSPDETDQKSYWVHVEADEGNREALDEWIDRLNLGSYISDQMKRPADEWMSQVLCTKSTALVMIRIVQLTDEKGKFVFDEVEYLTAIVTERMLLTYDVTNVTSAHTTNALIAHMTQDEVLREASSSAALISWLEFHVRNTKDAAICLRNETVLMTKKMDHEPKTVHLKDVLNLRGDVLFIDSVAEEQNQCLAMMRDMDTESDGADFTNIEGALEMLVKTAKSTELMSGRMEKRADDLKNAFGSHQQEQLNRKLAVLTVMSAIFMPLTFGAGVYGMNFDNIPELSTEYGYFIWWGVMLTVALAMSVFFYIDGWF